MHPRRRRGERPAPSRVRVVSMQRREADRRPVRGEHLDVRRLRQSVRRERERHRGDDRHVVTPREGVGEVVSAEGAQDERRDERDVVADERLTGQRVQRAGDGHRARGDARKTRRRPERDRRPERSTSAAVSGTALSRPPQEPGRQEWIAEIVRNAVQPDRKRPRVGDGNRGVCQDRQERRARGVATSISVRGSPRCSNHECPIRAASA